MHYQAKRSVVDGRALIRLKALYYKTLQFRNYGSIRLSCHVFSEQIFSFSLVLAYPNFSVNLPVNFSVKFHSAGPRSQGEILQVVSTKTAKKSVSQEY